MKNAALILNAVLLVLVGILFYLHFSSRKKPDAAVVKSTTREEHPGSFRIAYFEMDSVENSFEMVKDVKADLSKEEDRLNGEMNRLQKQYNDKLTQYQRTEMSQVQSEAASKEMLAMQDEIRGKKQNMDQHYQDLYMRKMQDVKAKIEEFLKEYNKDRTYSYIFSNEPGFIYYKDTAFNITHDLVKGLNNQYHTKK
jgi:outer membrane protein